MALFARSENVELDPRTPGPIRRLDLYVAVGTAAFACVAYVAALFTTELPPKGFAVVLFAAVPLFALRRAGGPAVAGEGGARRGPGMGVRGPGRGRGRHGSAAHLLPRGQSRRRGLRDRRPEPQRSLPAVPSRAGRGGCRRGAGSQPAVVAAEHRGRCGPGRAARRQRRAAAVPPARRWHVQPRAGGRPVGAHRADGRRGGAVGPAGGARAVGAAGLGRCGALTLGVRPGAQRDRRGQVPARVVVQPVRAGGDVRGAGDRLHLVGPRPAARRRALLRHRAAAPGGPAAQLAGPDPAAAAVRRGPGAGRDAGRGRHGALRRRGGHVRGAARRVARDPRDRSPAAARHGRVRRLHAGPGRAPGLGRAAARPARHPHRRGRRSSAPGRRWAPSSPPWPGCP